MANRNQPDNIRSISEGRRNHPAPVHYRNQNPAAEQAPVRKLRNYYDYSLLFILIFIFAIGLLVIYSGSQYMALQKRNDATYFFKRQLLIGGTGLIFAVIGSLFDYKLLRGAVSRILFIGASGLVGFVLVAGMASHGKTRWLALMGSSFQPTEVAKICMIVFAAAFISERGPAMNRNENWITLAGFSAIPTLLITSQNISSGIIVAMIIAIMLFVALDNYKVFMGLLAAAVAFVLSLKPVLHTIIIKAGMVEEPSKYYLKRVVGWAAPEIFEDDAYQTVQGLYAIGSGGMTGHGLGDSIQKYGAIPEVQNDMIFTIICEEFGFVGAATILLLYFYLIYRIYKIAQNARDMFGTMLCTGVMAHLGLQVALNVAVVTGVIPNTGVTLPFISYGGSAVFFTMLEMGMVLSVAHRIKV